MMAKAGSGTRPRHACRVTPSRAGRVRWSDFNGDGAPDLLVGAIQVPGFVPLQLRAWQNDGKGHFTDMTATVVPGITVGRSWSMGQGDLDSDGKTDVLVGGWDTQARLLLSDIEGHRQALPPVKPLQPK